MDDNQNQSNLQIEIWILTPAIVLNALFFGICGNSWLSFPAWRAVRMQVVNGFEGGIKQKNSSLVMRNQAKDSVDFGGYGKYFS